MINAQYLPVGGSLTFVEQHGDGEPVLCLHTAGQSGVQWRHTAPALAERGYRVVVPDLPGHGRSEPAAGGPVTDLGGYAEWCLRLIERLELDRPYVVGCSIGGKIALELGCLASGRLAGVVAMAADAWTAGRPSERGLRRELSDVAAPSRADRTYLGTLAVLGRAVSARRGELIATMHRREDPAVSISDLIGWTRHDLRERLADVRCPVHLAVGDEDLWLDVESVRWAARRIAGARVTVLNGIGHYPMEEIEGFDGLLAGWLTELAKEATR